VAINWSRYESNKFFSTKNFDGPADFTIKSVSEEAVGQNKEVKPVVYVREDPKWLVLNVTRGKALRKAYGDDDRRWIGKRFRLLKMAGTFKGEVCEMLVVQAPVLTTPTHGVRPVQAQQEAEINDETPSPDDWEVADQE
jgi:hypothetical protein